MSPMLRFTSMKRRRLPLSDNKTRRLHLLPTSFKTLRIGQALAFASMESFTSRIPSSKMVPSCAVTARYALVWTMKRILVTGATGNLGRAVVVALRNKGANARAGGRDTKRLNVIGGETVVFDYANPSTVSAAFQDVDGLFLVRPPLDAEAPAKLKPVIDLAKDRGVRHIVFNSALGVDAVEQAPLRVCERYLMGSGVPYTIIRPNFFMENFSTGFLAPRVKSG